MQNSPLNRRNFVKTVGGTSALAALGGSSLSAGLFSGPSPSSAAETAVTEFYKSLTEAQKSKMCFGFNNKLRNKINANWHICEETIGSDFYTDKQRGMIDQVVKGLSSEAGYKKLRKLDQ